MENLRSQPHVASQRVHPAALYLSDAPSPESSEPTIRNDWSLALFGSDSATKVGAKRRSKCRVTFENETRRKPVAGRDEYGGSNVFWYFSSSQQASVYAGTGLEKAARVSESLIGDGRKWQLGSPRNGNYYQRHTTPATRASAVSSRS
jgi:hypothetical protein